MPIFNKCILLGNVCADPSVRYTPNGNAVANFSIALNRKYKQGEEIKEEVSFIDIVVFNKQAENVGKFVFKGDSVLIEGRLQQRRWIDEASGAKRNKVEVIAQSVTFMPKRNKGQESSEPGTYGDQSPVEGGEYPIPF